MAHGTRSAAQLCQNPHVLCDKVCVCHCRRGDPQPGLLHHQGSPGAAGAERAGEQGATLAHSVPVGTRWSPPIRTPCHAHSSTRASPQRRYAPARMQAEELRKRIAQAEKECRALEGTLRRLVGTNSEMYWHARWAGRQGLFWLEKGPSCWGGGEGRFQGMPPHRDAGSGERNSR